MFGWPLFWVFLLVFSLPPEFGAKPKFNSSFATCHSRWMLVSTQRNRNQPPGERCRESQCVCRALVNATSDRLNLKWHETCQLGIPVPFVWLLLLRGGGFLWGCFQEKRETDTLPPFGSQPYPSWKQTRSNQPRRDDTGHTRRKVSLDSFLERCIVALCVCSE